ncbi:MAG: hypothetical protein WBM41_14945 [Arenicellales bacterium]
MTPATDSLQESAEVGTDNLLLKCIRITGGESVLLILEPEAETVYDHEAWKIIQDRIKNVGCSVEVMRPNLITDPKDFPESVATAMQQHDHTLFLSRIGDYSRFTPLPGIGSKTLCYARTAEMLASPFAAICHQLMSTLLEKLENELMAAEIWRINCDLGTDIQGTFCWPSQQHLIDDEFSLGLFPVTTFKPVPCDTAHGQVALSRWLVPGAAAKLKPSTLSFDDLVNVEVQQGTIKGIRGPKQSVQRIADFYDFVSQQLRVTRDRVHSWHAGINPFTYYRGDVDTELEKWGAISFASPRYLHFHTCGDVPPGEIAWSVFNPTVQVDGETFWEDGQFTWLQRKDNLEILAGSKDGETLLQASQDIGT